ncbi:hypothetical protein BH23CHL7_BH23CHL7_07190 [soil metagenome]
MKFTPGLILLIIAIVLFLVAALGIAVASLNLVALGLAAFAAAFVLDKWSR